MSHAAIASTVFVATLGLSLVLVWRSIAVGSTLQVVNRASKRSVGRAGVPRIGGVAVAIAFWVGVALSFALPVVRFPIETERIALIVIAGAVVITVMVVDDAIGLRPLTKLMVQFAAAAIIVLPRLRDVRHGISIDQFNAPLLGQVNLPVWFAIVATLIWVVALMNTLNWIDGIDGLAPTVTLVAATIMFLHTYFWPRGDPQFTVSILPLALGAAVLGFLPFNWSPARITLGDAGSNFVGLTLAAISIVGGAKMATALMVLGLPLLDFAWVMARRAASGQSLALPDKSHLHHRLLARGWSVGQIVAFVGGVSLLFGVLSLLLPNREAKLAALIGLVAILLFTVGGPWQTESLSTSRR